MIAADTNVIVRLVVGDDPAQAARARRFVEREDVFIPNTVLLEAEWVLRRSYGFSRDATLQAFRALGGLPHVFFEQPDRIAFAIARCAAGMDFADALHLSAALQCDGVATFDRAFARDIERASDMRMVRL